MERQTESSTHPEAEAGDQHHILPRQSPQDEQPNTEVGEPSRQNDSQPLLSRQSSVYSLTLEEFQSSVPRDDSRAIGSLNLEEYLNDILNAEGQNIPVENEGVPTNPNISTQNRPVAIQSGLIRQGWFNLPHHPSQKFDEVWDDIHIIRECA